MLSSLSPPSLLACLWHQGLEVASGKKHWDSDKPAGATGAGAKTCVSAGDI